MLSVPQTIILSVIEGITEFLPISSTGHLILATKLLHITESEFTKSFEIFIQLGAIMAVVSLYFKKIIQTPKILVPITIAFVPTAILGFIFYKTIKTYLLGNDMVVVSALSSVGLLLIIFEYFWNKSVKKATKSLASLTPREAICIGLSQSFSMIPGVSRAAATIVGGMIVGLSRKDAVEFSFLLAVPTMAAATGLDLVKSAYVFTTNELLILAIGFIVSWVAALIVIKAFVRFVKRATFVGFGVYRIAIAILYGLIVFV